MSIVPDAIEPVEGWKAWCIGPGGKLCSPSLGLVWPPGERAEAGCEVRATVSMGWEADSRPNGSETAAVSTRWVNAYQCEYDPAPEPAIALPPGLRWFYRQRVAAPHNAPHDSCQCGIYIADSPEQARHYGDVVGKVAGWGTVIKHAHGARVQYAYPTELHVTPDQAEKLADYSVPLVVTRDPRKSRHGLFSALALTVVSLLNLAIFAWRIAL